MADDRGLADSLDYGIQSQWVAVYHRRNVYPSDIRDVSASWGEVRLLQPHLLVEENGGEMDGGSVHHDLFSRPHVVVRTRSP